MIIKKILKSDIKDLARLMVSVYNAPPWNDKWTEETAFESLLTVLEFPTFYGNIIVDEDRIIGAIIGHTRRYATETTYYIDEFFVSEEYRRKGVASNLYKSTIDKLKKLGINGAFFTTLRNTAAYNFYIKMGAWDLSDSACFYHRFIF